MQNRRTSEELRGRGATPLDTVFVRTAGAILGIAGIAKVWTSLGDTKLLEVEDPFFGVEFRHLMLAVGLAEIGVALICFGSKRKRLPIMLVAWFTTNLVVYRLGLWWTGWKSACSCLGNLTDVLHISPQLGDNIMKVMLAWLLVGSYGLLLWRWGKSRGAGIRQGPSPILPTSV